MRTLSAVAVTIGCLGFATSAQAQQRLTVVGCLARVDGASNLMLWNASIQPVARSYGTNSPKASTPVGSAEAAVSAGASAGATTPKGSTPLHLTIVEAAPATFHAMSAKGSVPTSALVRYRLLTDERLAPHVGRQVTITGVVLGSSMAVESITPTPQACAAR